VTKTVVSEATGEPAEEEALTVTPHPIQSLVDEKFRAVKAVAGDSICAAINDQGDLRVWGCFRVSPLHHFLKTCLTDGGLGFIQGVDGVLGYSAKTENQFLPVPVLQLSQKAGDVEKVSDVASGHNHLLALTTHGVIYSWGDGEVCQLGRKLVPRRRISGTVPQKVVLGKRGKNRVVAIGAGGMTSFAVDEEGVLWGWGLNNLGQTGTGTTEMKIEIPTKVVGMSKEELGGATVVAMTGGEHHSLFLTSDGKLYACGRANAGQIGLPKDDPVFVDGEERRDHVRVPVEVKFPDEDDPIVKVSCGQHNNAAITEGGALYCWGQGPQGELGLKDEEEVWEPTVVVRKKGGKWKALSVSCGGQHTIGLFVSKD
jgi:Alpha-tubulin suppressor and related RCC1 domain-containing proteins